MAIQETLSADNTPIKIFCDSQKALKAIRHPFSHNENRFLREQIYDKAKRLQDNGQSVVCRWIPGHTGIVGYKKADLAARSKVEKGGK